MEVSMSQPDGHRERIRAEATTWLTKLLEHPRLEGISKPTSIIGYLYIDGTPRQLITGRWEVNETSVSLAGSTSSQSVPVFTRLAILTGVANLCGIMTGPLMDRFTASLVREIQASTFQIHNLMVSSVVKPRRIAVDNTNCRIAAEVNGVWTLPGGAPVQVDETWITMNF